MKFTTTLAYILYFLPLPVVLCAQEDIIDYDSQKCKASRPVPYCIKQPVPTTAQNLSNRAGIGTLLQENIRGLTSLTVDVIIKRYNREDDIHTSIDGPRGFWTLDLQERKEEPASGPLYVAIHTQKDREMVIGYIDCADDGGEFEEIPSSDWDDQRLQQSMELSRVWIHSQWGGRGLGSAMLRFALQDIATYTPSTHAILLAYDKDLISFYAKAGFASIDPNDDCIMGINLQTSLYCVNEVRSSSCVT